MRIGMMVAAATLWLSACGASENAPVVLVETSQVRPLLQFSDDLNGQRVAVDGYVHIDNGPGSEGIAMLFTLTSRPRGLGDDMLLFETDRGTEANQLDLPVLKRQNLPQIAGGDILLVDLKNARFQDSSGAAHPVSDKVRVTGRLASGAGAEESRSPTGQRFRPRLTDVSFEAAP